MQSISSIIKLSIAGEVCCNTVSRTGNKLLEISACIWITHKKLSHSVRHICLFKSSTDYGNSLIPCFGNYMGFCITQIILEALNFGVFLFSHTFPLLWEFTFPIFWESYGFVPQGKYARNLLGYLYFLILFPYYINSIFPFFGNYCMDFCFTKNI